MLFTTIFTATLLAQAGLSCEQQENKNVKYFKNLAPIVYQDQMISENTFTYSKVPTKMIKIDKNSN